MKQKLLKKMLLLCALVVGSGSVCADPATLFHETFGNNSSSARAWSDSYSVKSGVSAVYSGAAYTITEAKQSKNTMGQTASALVSTQGKAGVFIVGPLNASSYKSLAATNYFGMSAGTWNSTYSYMKMYYSTNGSSYTEVSRSGSTPTGSVGSNKNLVQASYTLPAAAQSSTLYLKFEFYCYQLNKSSEEIGQAYLDEVELTGIAAAIPPTFSLAEGSYSGTQSVELSCATDGASIYYTLDGTTPTTGSTLYSSAISVSETTTIKAIAVKAGLENSNVSSATYTITTDPIITLGSSSVAATTAETDGTITVNYSNLTNYDAEIYWYEDDGTTSATYDWLEAEINASTKNVDYSIAENTSTSSRTAYLKVYALGDEGEVYSSLITITQAGVDFVTLPFSYTSGRSDIATTTGISQSGLGSDYSSTSTNLKFESTGSNVILKTNAAIQSLIYDIKGNSFSGSSIFKVQTSVNGIDYSDLKEYTSLATSIVPELFTSIASDVRYIKWIYETKDKGNVGMGNIRVNCETATVTAAGYATFTSPAAVNFNGDIKAYIAKANGTTGVSFHQVTKVPANTGVLLYKEGGATELLPLFADDADDVSGNVFLPGTGAAVASDVETTKHNYILNNGASGLGFYHAAGQTVAVNKAYIQINEGAGVKGFIALPGSEETAVEAVKAETEDGVIFNLAGQRVSKLQRGINIINGKKVVVK